MALVLGHKGANHPLGERKTAKAAEKAAPPASQWRLGEDRVEWLCWGPQLLPLHTTCFCWSKGSAGGSPGCAELWAPSPLQWHLAGGPDSLCLQGRRARVAKRRLLIERSNLYSWTLQTKLRPLRPNPANSPMNSCKHSSRNHTHRLETGKGTGGSIRDRQLLVYKVLYQKLGTEQTEGGKWV